MTAVGTLIADRYRVVQRIAVGGMGLVWEAEDEVLRRRVAVKQLLLQAGLSDEEAALARDRVAREARITARLHHPSAVTLYDVVEHQGSPCLIMQFVPSRSLGAVLRERETLPLEMVTRIGAQVASALAAAHQVGIVHRDVKPGNILITADGSAKITDFGISHATGDVTVTTTGLLSGTPAYLAPEVARGGQSGFPSDVHSLGATLYAALEGTPPFGNDDNSMALLHRVSSGLVMRPQRSGDLTELLLRMMAIRPGDRPTMPEVVDELEGRLRGSGRAAGQPTTMLTAGALEHTQPAAPEPTQVQQPLVSDLLGIAPAHPAGRSAPDGRRRAAVLIGGLAAVLAAVLLAAFLAFRDDTGPTGTGTTVAGTDARTTAASAPGDTAGSSVTDALAPTPSPTPTPPPTPTPTPTPEPSPAETSAGQSPPAGSTPPTVASPSASAPPPAEPTQVPAPPAGEPGEADLVAAVTDYYAAMPGGTEQGWNRLTERYQTGIAQDRAYYDQFWGRVAEVSLSDVSVQAPDTVTATVTYSFTDGTRSVERTEFSMVVEGGILKFDDSEVVGQ